MSRHSYIFIRSIDCSDMCISFVANDQLVDARCCHERWFDLVILVASSCNQERLESLSHLVVGRMMHEVVEETKLLSRLLNQAWW